jgi:dynein heavy chain, axonemal
MNPKAITETEMYGKKSVTDEWTPGVFSKLWEMYNSKQKQNKKYWIVCDGPVDTLWIESLNTVLDDNKILTLPNGDRFPMAETVKLVFEVENLNNASPATVSRCGIVYIPIECLGSSALIKSWCQVRKHKDRTIIQKLLDQFLIPNEKYNLIEDLKRNCNQQIMQINVYVKILNIIRILNGILIAWNKNNTKVFGGEKKTSQRKEYLKIITYAIIWGIGGLYEEGDRKIMTEFMRDKMFPLPK